ncbi:MAG: NADH:flavin oxidoreductase, partial [Muribaculaceae bacterium]|nr:NADH:flavin oxidoreductase [Muribaculaceae bacterium]
THYMKQWWLKYGVRMVGKMMIPTVPFKELYFLDDARLFRSELKMPLVYVGGVVRRENADTVLDREGFDFIQMGRALLNEPDFVNRMRDDLNHRCGCDHVNYCIARMYSREMACHKHLDNLPKKIVEEIAEIKQRDGKK